MQIIQKKSVCLFVGLAIYFIQALMIATKTLCIFIVDTNDLFWL